MTNAHRDRLTCPRCLKVMRDRHALRAHMKATGHIRAVHPQTDDDIARAKMQHMRQDRLAAPEPR